MDLSKTQSLLLQIIEALSNRGIHYALCGGLVSNYYRSVPRTTNDVDIAIAAGEGTKEAAKEIILELGLDPAEVTKGMLTGGPPFIRKKTPVQIIVGRSKGNAEDGVDLILPAMPWVMGAVERAQSNVCDLGLGRTVHILTREDLIISKLFSYQDKNTRIKDLDDIKNIVLASKELDNEYLIKRLSEFRVPIPKTIVELFHYSVQRVARKNEKLGLKL